MSNQTRIMLTLAAILAAALIALPAEIARSQGPSATPTPAPSPESRIIYSVPSDRGITYYTMNADGSDKEVVEDDFFDGDRWITALGASYSPDGHALAFGAVDREGEYRTGDLDSDTLIHILDLESGTVTRLDTVGNSYKPLWSPDGSTIAFLADGQALHTIDLTTGIAQAMLDTVVLRNLVGMRGFVTSFDWSSDGSLLAADATMISGPEGGGYTSIFVMNSDGTDVHQALPPGISAKYPAWGPGNDILYCVCVPDSPGVRRVEICAIDLAASQINQITHFEGTPIGGISDLDVSNGDQIVFVSHPQEGNSDIYRYDPVTGALVNLTADIDVGVYAPRWIEKSACRALKDTTSSYTRAWQSSPGPCQSHLFGQQGILEEGHHPVGVLVRDGGPGLRCARRPGSSTRRPVPRRRPRRGRCSPPRQDRCRWR